jgi:hypothetical protein
MVSTIQCATNALSSSDGRDKRCKGVPSLANSEHPGFSGRFHCGLSPAFSFLFDGFFFIPWVLFHPYFQSGGFTAKSLPDVRQELPWVASLDGISSSHDVEFVSGWPFMAVFLQVVWVGDPQRVSMYQSYTTTTLTTTSSGMR